MWLALCCKALERLSVRRAGSSACIFAVVGVRACTASDVFAAQVRMLSTYAEMQKRHVRRLTTTMSSCSLVVKAVEMEHYGTFLDVDGTVFAWPNACQGFV